MAQHTGIVSSWDLPNFVGELYTADAVPGQREANPSFLTLVGGLNGQNARIVEDMQYNMTVEFDYPNPSQPNISENSSITVLPDPVNPIYTNTRNTCQIYQESVAESYVSKATRGRLITDQLYPIGAPTEGWLSATSPNRDAAALVEQISYALARIARNANHTFLNGAYVEATSKAVASRTKGIITGITTNAVAAVGAALSETLIGTLMQNMVTNSSGKAFQYVPILMMNAFQKRKFSAIYAFPPEHRNIGGYNITMYETDFGTVGVMYEPTIPVDTVLFVSLAIVKPVFNEVPGKGVLFYENKPQIGAAEGGMLYGHIGIDYGPEWMHGKITGLATV
jgi:hypothetical protein